MCEMADAANVKDGGKGNESVESGVWLWGPLYAILMSIDIVL